MGAMRSYSRKRRAAMRGRTGGPRCLNIGSRSDSRQAHRAIDAVTESTRFPTSANLSHRPVRIAGQQQPLKPGGDQPRCTCNAPAVRRLSGAACRNIDIYGKCLLRNWSIKVIYAAQESSC